MSMARRCIQPRRASRERGFHGRGCSEPSSVGAQTAYADRFPLHAALVHSLFVASDRDLVATLACAPPADIAIRRERLGHLGSRRLPRYMERAVARFIGDGLIATNGADKWKLDRAVVDRFKSGYMLAGRNLAPVWNPAMLLRAASGRQRGACGEPPSDEKLRMAARRGGSRVRGVRRPKRPALFAKRRAKRGRSGGSIEANGKEDP